MPAPVPTSEPASFTAGETLAWTRALPDYPASLWTLKYALQLGIAAPITLTATASGDTFAIDVAPATSAAYPPGVYMITGFVEQIAVTHARHVVSVGALRILPSPLAALGSTHASRMLVLIQSALEGRIPNGLETTNIDGQELVRIQVPDLHRLRQKYKAEVALEIAAARAAAGLRVRRTIGIQFRNP